MIAHFDTRRSQKVWDNQIRKFGDPALLRQPGRPDRLVSSLSAQFTALERMGMASNPTDRKFLISALDPTTGLPLSPDPSEKEMLVTLTTDDQGVPTGEDEQLKMVAPPTRVGPTRATLYWKLQVRDR